MTTTRTRGARRILLMAFSLGALTLSAAGCGDLAGGEVTVDETSSAIVGGAQATPNEFPWMANLGGCGGSLIHPQWVLTAAHCVSAAAQNGVSVTLGDHDRTIVEPTQVTRQSAKVRWLPPLQGSNNDIALIKLATAVPLAPATSPILFQTTPPAVGTMMTVSGWGNIGWQMPSPNILKKAQLPILDLLGACGAATTNPLLCAGFAGGSPGTCHGDSGGPLAFKQPNGAFYLAGVVSGGGKCDGPGTFTAVSQFASWIRSTMYQPTSIAARMTDGLVYHRSLDETTQTWSAWSSLGAQPTGASLTLDGSGRQTAFACSGGAVTFDRTNTSTLGTWSGWSSLGGNCSGVPAAAMNGDTQPLMMIFAVGTDGQVRTAYFTGANPGWGNLPALGGFQGGLGAATTRSGRTYVFGRRTTNDIWMTYREPNAQTWAAWTSVGGNFAAAPGVHASWDGALHLFAITSTGVLQTRSLHPINGWSAWTVVPQGTAFAPGSQPAVVDADDAKNILIVGQSNANKVKVASYDLLMKTWTPFTVLSGAQNLASSPGAL